MIASVLVRLVDGVEPEQLLSELVDCLVDAGVDGAAIHLPAPGVLLQRAVAGDVGDLGRLPERTFEAQEETREGRAVCLPLAARHGTLTVVGGSVDLAEAAAAASVLAREATTVHAARQRRRGFAGTLRKAARVAGGTEPRPALQSLVEDVATLAGSSRVVVLERLPDGWAPAAGTGVSLDVLRADVLPSDAIRASGTPGEPQLVLDREDAPAVAELVGGPPLAVAVAEVGGRTVGTLVAAWDAEPDDGAVLIVGALADIVGLGLAGGRSAVDLDADLRQTREDFLSTLSHELRTPLAVIKGAIETLQVHGDDLEPRVAARLVERIRHRVDQEVELIDMLLSLSRLDRGQLVLHRTPFDLRHVADEVAREHAEASGRRVGIDGPPEAPILADRVAVRQVISNLAGNAVKFSRGDVRLGIERVRSGWRVEVDDDGEGIPPALRERIFERFLQATPSPHRGGGVGVGLAVVRGLVELHGGHVGVGTSPAGGARFWFVLPDPVTL